MKSKLEVKLESMIESLKEMQDILTKSSNIENIGNTMVYYKKIEDGILECIPLANKHQLNTIMNDYKFGYYTEFNKDKDLLRSEINKRIRDHKLKKLL